MTTDYSPSLSAARLREMSTAAVEKVRQPSRAGRAAAPPPVLASPILIISRVIIDGQRSVTSSVLSHIHRYLVADYQPHDTEFPLTENSIVTNRKTASAWPSSEASISFN